MEFSLGVVIGVRQRNFLRQRAMALVMTFLFVVALVATVAANSLVALPGSIWGLEPLVGLIVRPPAWTLAGAEVELDAEFRQCGFDMHVLSLSEDDGAR